MATVEFYISNYRSSGSIVSTEYCFQTIPMTGTVETAILSPKVKASMGKAGSFEFSMYSDHPLYNSLIQYTTKMRVVYQGNELFRGRVLTIDKTFDRMRTVHCEGMLSYFMDSHQEGTKEETRPTITVLTYLQQLITQHNSDIQDASRAITLGEVPGQYSASIASEQQVTIPSEKASQQFGSTSWNTTMDRLEDLLDMFGGYMRIRCVNGVNYLDWLDRYYNANLNSQPVALNSNLIDLSGTTEIENLFTAVIPIGKGSSNDNLYIDSYWPIASSGHAQVKYITVPELASLGLYTDAELNTLPHRKVDYQNAIANYGWIWKVVEFENANSAEKLFAYAKDWMKNNFMPELTQWSVSALDLLIPGESASPLIAGDRITLTHPEVDTTYGDFSIIDAEYDLYNMEKSQYTIGIPNQQVNASYGVAEKQEKSGKSSGKSSGGSSKYKPPVVDPEEIIEDLKTSLDHQYILKTSYSEDITLDDPGAYFYYDNTGKQLTTAEVQKKVMDYTPELNKNAMLISDPVIFRNKATQYGIDPDDPKAWSKVVFAMTIAENTELRADQARWKINVMQSMTDLGLSYQEVEVLLNEKVGSSWLANLVDDSGNWTAAAIQDGYHRLPGAADIKQQAIDTRKILSGENVAGSGLLSNLTGWIFGSEGINVGGDLINSYKEEGVGGVIAKSVEMVGNLLGIGTDTNSAGDVIKSVTGGDNGNLFNFNLSDLVSGVQTVGTQLLGDLFSGVSTTLGDGAKNAVTNILSIFNGSDQKDSNGNIISRAWDWLANNMHLDGGNGVQQIGASQDSQGNPTDLNGWKVRINDPITYTAVVDGVTKSFTIAPGCVGASDFHFTAKYDSLYSKLIVTDNFIADQATINALTANKLTVLDTITAAQVTVENYVSAWHMNCTNLIASNNIYAGSHIYVEDTDENDVDVGRCFNDALFSEQSDGTIKLSLSRANGSTSKETTFRIAATNKYITDVAAARANGRGDVYVNNITINAGDTNTYYLKYLDPDTQQETNTGETFTVTAGSGGSVSHGPLAVSGITGSNSTFPGGVNITLNKSTYSHYKLNITCGGEYVDHIDITLD